MAFTEAYRRQVELLVRVLPLLAQEGEFALKGGTAINLFHRDLPRLSVDIDLAFLPLSDRPAALGAIDAAMKRLAKAIEQVIPGAKVANTVLQSEGVVTKLVVNTNDALVKVEVTPVLRGSVYPPEIRPVSAAVEDAFGFAEAKLVSFPDLYAGKIVAALDRQHPRDLFDVRDLLANESVDDHLRRAFIVYLLSHNRPMAEVLSSPPKDITQAYERGFQGMTENEVSLDELLEARAALVDIVIGGMPADHRRFLIGFERGQPDWALLGLPGAAELPAVRWRQQNLDGLKQEHRSKLVDALEAVLAAP